MILSGIKKEKMYDYKLSKKIQSIISAKLPLKLISGGLESFTGGGSRFWQSEQAEGVQCNYPDLD